MSQDFELPLDECTKIIIEKLGNKGRYLLLEMRRAHNKAIHAEHGVRPSSSAAKAAKRKIFARLQRH